MSYIRCVKFDLEMYGGKLSSEHSNLLCLTYLYSCPSICIN